MIETFNITEPELIEAVLSDPEMFARISDDGADVFKAPFGDDTVWLGVSDNDVLIGVIFFHMLNSVTVQIHIHVPEEFRGVYSMPVGTEVIKWFADSDFRKLVAVIPVIYKDVLLFTRKFGFEDEGINRASFMKNGKLVDQHYLGLTREEAQSWLRQH